MPVTLPAHAAAILPLHRLRPQWFPPVALTVGACSPDIAYLLGVNGGFTHTLPGVALFCLPMGGLLYLWSELLLLPTLRAVLPTWRGVEWARFAGSRGLPRTAGGWLSAAAALVIGALTHLLWDGFTHRWRWPADALYGDVKLRLFGAVTHVPWLLQLTTSILGSWVVLHYLARLYPSLPPAPGNPRGRPAVTLIAVTALGGAVTMGAYLWFPLATGFDRMWGCFWTWATGAFFALSVACIVHRWRHDRVAASAGG